MNRIDIASYMCSLGYIQPPRFSHVSRCFHSFQSDVVSDKLKFLTDFKASCCPSERH